MIVLNPHDKRPAFFSVEEIINYVKDSFTGNPAPVSIRLQCYLVGTKMTVDCKNDGKVYMVAMGFVE